MLNEAGVEEQSHKDDMRAAIRGDFERLHARLETGGEADDRRASAGANRPDSRVGAEVEQRPSWLGRLLTRH